VPQVASTSLSLLFETIEKHKQALRIEDYAVTQTTLEQVFLIMAKQQDLKNQNFKQVSIRKHVG
jgi:hypothetical protein